MGELQEAQEAERVFWILLRTTWIPRLFALAALVVLFGAVSYFGADVAALFRATHTGQPVITSADAKFAARVKIMSAICQRGMADAVNAKDRETWYLNPQYDRVSEVTMPCFNWLVRDPDYHHNGKP